MLPRLHELGQRFSKDINMNLSTGYKLRAEAFGVLPVEEVFHHLPRTREQGVHRLGDDCKTFGRAGNFKDSLDLPRSVIMLST